MWCHPAQCNSNIFCWKTFGQKSSFLKDNLCWWKHTEEINEKINGF